MEADVRSVWARTRGAGARALALAAALLRGATPPATRHHTHVLAALEVLPDHELFATPNTYVAFTLLATATAKYSPLESCFKSFVVVTLPPHRSHYFFIVTVQKYTASWSVS